MSTDLRTRADSNLAAAAAALRMDDPRPAYRERLRSLKERDPDRFGQALRHYDETVLPALADGRDVFAAWVQYGHVLANLTAAGRMMSVDSTGRAVAYAPPVQESTLILHIPDDNSVPILVAARPAILSRAQQATLDLLVSGRLELSAASD